mgnify:FL=1
MSLILRQSTSVVVSFGPFLDKTDGVTPETGLVSAIDHATTGILLSKNGGALTIRSQAVTASTYDAYGNYRVTLSATDTNTVGPLRAQFIETAPCLPVWADFQVVEEEVYDDLYAASAVGYLKPATAGRDVVVDAAGLVDATMVKNGPTGAGTAQTAGDVIGDTNDIQARLPAALVGGRMDASVGANAAGVITAAAHAAGAIDAAAIATGAITAAKFAAGAIDAAAIATGAVDADAIADNAIDAGAIAADAITAAKIADGAIDAATFAAGAINAAAIAADAITAAKIADGAIDAATFAAGAIDAAAIATDAITAAKIAADAIGASELADGAIDAASIAAGAITAAKFAAGAIDAAAIATGAIDADAIATDALGALELSADAVTEIADAISARGSSGTKIR